jgi:hypothetical protein
MPYRTSKQTQDVEAVDIQTMAAMSLSDYNKYLRDGLFFIDHHDVLRSAPAQYPLAVTKEQYKALMAYLTALEPRIGN